MSDLVERLRWQTISSHADWAKAVALGAEAADEIERLTALRNTYIDTVAKQAEFIEQQRNEIDGLDDIIDNHIRRVDELEAKIAYAEEFLNNFNEDTPHLQYLRSKIKRLEEEINEKRR